MLMFVRETYIYHSLLAESVKVFTCMTEDPSKGRLAAVTGEPVRFFHTNPIVLAELAIAATMTRASRSDSRRYLRPLLQIQSNPVQLQGADATQKAFLS